MTDFLHTLNDRQLEAVKQVEGPVLIMAGAGSGKTNALTCRIAYMLSLGIRPSEILAITFTTKAAKEMRDRVHSLVGSRQNLDVYLPFLRRPLPPPGNQQLSTLYR